MIKAVAALNAPYREQAQSIGKFRFVDAFAEKIANETQTLILQRLNYAMTVGRRSMATPTRA
jgi:hypothetical protein